MSVPHVLSMKFLEEGSLLEMIQTPVEKSPLGSNAIRLGRENIISVSLNKQHCVMLQKLKAISINEQEDFFEIHAGLLFAMKVSNKVTLHVVKDVEAGKSFFTAIKLSNKSLEYLGDKVLKVIEKALNKQEAELRPPLPIETRFFGDIYKKCQIAF